MTHHITGALRQIGDEVAAVISPATICEVSSQVEHQWGERILDPVTTFHLFALQILHAITASSRRARLTGQTFSASAYCQARARLPLALLERLLERLSAVVRTLTDRGRRRRQRT